MKKTTLIAIIIVSAAVIAFSVLLALFLNNNDREENRGLYNSQEISIKVDGIEVGRVSEQALREIYTSNFQAVLKSSDMLTPIEKTYTGTEIKLLLAHFNIDLTDKSHIVATAGDGLAKSYDIAAVNKDNELYITYEVEGKDFSSGMGIVKEGENGGPYVIIIKSEQFSNNRLKMLTSIDVITKK